MSNGCLPIVGAFAQFVLLGTIFFEVFENLSDRPSLATEILLNGCIAFGLCAALFRVSGWFLRMLDEHLASNAFDAMSFIPLFFFGGLAVTGGVFQAFFGRNKVDGLPDMVQLACALVALEPLVMAFFMATDSDS